MEKLKFDSGLKSYKLGQGVLRFNPADPNVYARFLEAAEKITALEKTLQEKAAALEGADPGTAVVRLFREADREMKGLLDWVFGPPNDFDAILGGLNLLAVAENGERVVTNLLQALMDPLVQGAKSCAGQQVQAARAKAQARRAAQ